MREWMALVESKSGERGIFNRQASKKQAEKYKSKVTLTTTLVLTPAAR